LGREVGPTGGLPPEQPVTAAVLVRGVARRRVRELQIVALPVKIRGATGSMVDPVAVI
jgi:kynurenine formamidase